MRSVLRYTFMLSLAAFVWAERSPSAAARVVWALVLSAVLLYTITHERMNHR